MAKRNIFVLIQRHSSLLHTHIHLKFFFFLEIIYLSLCWVFIAVLRLLLVVASPVVEHGLYACGLQSLWYMGLVVAYGFFQDPGLNPCPLHCQADSEPLDCQGNPHIHLILTLSFLSTKVSYSGLGWWSQILLPSLP